MANLTFTLLEVITLIRINVKLPNQIEGIEIVNNIIKLKINIGKLIPNINVFVNFDSYQNGMLKLNIEAVKVLKLFSKYLSKIIEKMLYSDVISFHNGEMLHVALNRILRQKIKGVQVKSITEDNGEFKIVI